VTLRAGSRRLAWAALAAGFVAATAACGVSGLEFVTDNRLHVTAPADRALVHLPVTLRWTMSDFTAALPGTAPPSKDAGYFAVFVDRHPVRPGQTLAEVITNRSQCAPQCAAKSYLATQGVYTTVSPILTLRQVDPIDDHQAVQLHEAVIVLMDTTGRRIGESAWYVDFRLRHVSP
jgi:hypothetical protein